MNQVDLLFLTHNRLEFTRESFAALLANTHWPVVSRLYLYDDASEDGTREFLRGAVHHVPVSCEVRLDRFGSPVAALAEFVSRATAPLVAKIDNDTMLPPGWLRYCHQVMIDHPELDLLGIEPMGLGNGDTPYFRAGHIGGIGLFRRSAFAEGRLIPDQKYFGFQAWQNKYKEKLIYGWLNPPLRVFLLDRIPFAPWSEYSERYVAAGWQRPWPKYSPADNLWNWWEPCRK